MIAVSELKNGIDEWLWRQVTYPLAVTLVNRGITRRRRTLRWLCGQWPMLGTAVLMLAEIARPSNSIVWVWDDEAPDIDGLLSDVAEMINRAPAPLGFDDYKVIVERLGRLPDDEDRLDLDRAEVTLTQRPVLAMQQATGDRWYDWKRGTGKQDVRALLAQAVPRPEAPMTLVRVVVTGSALAHAQPRKH